MTETADPGGTPTAVAPPPDPGRLIGAPAAQVVGWLAVALVNAGLIALRAAPARFGVRAMHHLYDAGQLLAMGWLSYWVARGVLVLVRRRALRFSLLLAGALAVALLLLADDLTGFTRRQSAAGSRVPWRLLIPLAAAAGITALAVLGRALDRPWLRWLPVGLAMTAAGANHFVLSSGYPGVHFFIAWAAAVLLGSALADARWPAWPPWPRERRTALAMKAVATLAAVGTLVVRPSEAVWSALYWSPGSAIPPVLARVRSARGRDGGPHYYQGSPWFRDRGMLPDVQPHRPPLGPERGIVILITVDAMRADLVSDDRHAGKLPALHALRKQSADFTMARAPTPSTVTTLTSILTGKYYSQLYWTEIPAGPFKGTPMPREDASPRVPQLLQAEGVHSIHVMSLHGLAADVGMGVGFTEELRCRRDYGRAAEVMDLAMAGLSRAGDAPVFMFMHFVDPHAPYDLAGNHGSSHARYVREVALVDREIGRLVGFLDAKKLAERTTLIVSADHGEAFGEHNLNYHASSVYDELMRVPLLVRSPTIAPRRIAAPVTLVDLGPTILDLMGAPTPATFMGESLVPLLRGESARFTRPIAADAGRRMQAMVFPDGFKAVTDLNRKTIELYDLRTDPGETRNLVDELGRDANRYTGALHAFFDAHTLQREGYVVPWRQF